MRKRIAQVEAELRRAQTRGEAAAAKRINWVVCTFSRHSHAVFARGCHLLGGARSGKLQSCDHAHSMGQALACASQTQRNLRCIGSAWLLLLALLLPDDGDVVAVALCLRGRGSSARKAPFRQSRDSFYHAPLSHRILTYTAPLPLSPPTIPPNIPGPAECAKRLNEP